MSPERVRRILKALGWRQAEFLRRLSRATRSTYKSGDAWKWMHGGRRVPPVAALFLRMSVRIAVLERRVKRLSQERR